MKDVVDPTEVLLANGMAIRISIRHGDKRWEGGYLIDRGQMHTDLSRSPVQWGRWAVEELMSHFHLDGDEQ
jgi:hypothetical protein